MKKFCEFSIRCWNFTCETIIVEVSNEEREKIHIRNWFHNEFGIKSIQVFLVSSFFLLKTENEWLETDSWDIGSEVNISGRGPESWAFWQYLRKIFQETKCKRRKCRVLANNKQFAVFAEKNIENINKKYKRNAKCTKTLNFKLNYW